MHDFQGYLQELSSSSDIKFRLISEGGMELFNSLGSITEENCFSIDMDLGKKRVTLTLERNDARCAAILKFSIENKYKDYFYLKEQLIIDILEGVGVAAEVVDNTLPFLYQGATLFLISIDGSLYEALNTLRQLYSDENIVALSYEEHLLILGVFEDVEEHASSIIDAIALELYSKCYISYSTMSQNSFDLKKAYDSARECLAIGRKYNLGNQIYNSSSMLFEKAVYNIAPRIKEQLLESLGEGLDNLDHDMISTIEEFLKSGLNISEAAKNIYVHRNTLIYRLDKIAKETGYDIREFNQAMIFTIAFLIWKEKKQ